MGRGALRECKPEIPSEKMRKERLNRNFVWSPLRGAEINRVDVGWKIGQQETHYWECVGYCWCCSVCSHVCLSLSSSPQALRLIFILPLMSSLNLSEYSHKYLATTNIRNHPLVSPSFLPCNASSSCSFALPPCYSETLFISLSLYGFI